MDNPVALGIRQFTEAWRVMCAGAPGYVEEPPMALNTSSAAHQSASSTSRSSPGATFLQMA